MSVLPPELLVKIIRCCLCSDPGDVRGIRRDWLSLRHTSTQLRALLLCVDVQDLNPHKSCLARFYGQLDEETGFQAAGRGVKRWVEHMGMLQSTTPFPITLRMEFWRCTQQPTSDICAVFNSLENVHVIENIQSLSIMLATNQTHEVSIPTFPNLKSLCLRLEDETSKAPHPMVGCCLRLRGDNYEDKPTHFIVRAPALRTLTVTTSNPSIIRIESPWQLEHLSLDLQQVGCLRHPCEKDTLQHMVARPQTMFEDFGRMATGLTRLDMSVKVSWLDGTNILQFPNLTVFNLRVINPRCQPVSAPVTTLELPKVEMSHLFLCDTRIINFAGSFLPKLRELRLFTPCYVKDIMGQEEGTLTRNNFIVEYQSLEHIMIAVHGIDRSSWLPLPVQWERVKRVTLAMDVGIADIVGQVTMPMLEEVTLLYPQWRKFELPIGRGWDELRDATTLIDIVYGEEITKLSHLFPDIPIRGCFAVEEPDKDNFDVIGKLTTL